MLRRVRAELRQAADQMARRPELCCGAILLTCALILPITFTCGPVKNVVAAARTPVRFFPAEVPVVDLFLGQLDEADRLREDADVAVLFYYAPWCTHSITARQHIRHVALQLAEEVQFVAINCWWHHGKCRKQKNFFQYPVIHLYYRRFGPIEYRAPVRSEYLVSFIQRVSRPLTYLPNPEALHTFLSHHQGVVGYFEFKSSPQPAGYIIFLFSALNALKRDHQGVVRFAVVTNQVVAEGISLREDESVYLHRRLNSSLVFPRAERNFTAESVCDWVYENRESVIDWIQPTGAKSYLLEVELLKGPALLTFLPHNPLRASQLLTQVSDVALRYHTCCKLEGVMSTVSQCCQSLMLSRWSSAVSNSPANVCELCVNRCGSTSCLSSHVLPVVQSHCSVLELQAVLDLYLRHVPVSSASCSHIQTSYSPYSQYSACCRPLQNSQHHPLLDDPITGLQCRTNKTLRFYLLDSDLNWPLAQRLGAPANHSALPFITIVSLRDETHYLLNNTDSLEHFIQNFSVPYSHLHRHLVGQKQQHHSQSLIQEVTSHNFLDTVMDSDRDVLLLYYSSWCGFCSVLNHVFLRLAHLFQGNGALTVARVNVALNDLPWEFMVDHLPSILFFPRHKKQMSVKFPENINVTLPNLFRFILQHMSHAPWESGGVMGSKSLLEVELQALQQEVFSLQRAQKRLSQQLAALWRENHHLTLHPHTLESRSAKLQAQSSRLETLYREKTRQLTDTIHRLQELADVSEELLKENSLLKMLLSALRDKQTGSRETDRQEAEREMGKCEAS